MRPVLRKEGRDKVTGKATYVDDQALPRMLHGVTIRTPCARGRIRGLTFAPHIPWEEFVVVTAKDIPGHNAVALLTDDQPYLTEDVFNHAEEPVALLAHSDKYLLEEARRAVTVEVEPLEPIFGMEHSDKVFKSFLIDKGDVDSVWAIADFVVDGRIRQALRSSSTSRTTA
jgi:CO/xanthine dehydrogenase Mo-binding subunit